jgi:signal transduction histidine kinase
VSRGARGDSDTLPLTVEPRSQERVVPQCEFCDEPAVQLARTATRVWIGCPHCHRTWIVDAESSEGTVGEIVFTPECTEPRQMSVIGGSLIAVLTVSLALVLRMFLRPILGSSSPFLLFTPAVAISAFYGGVVPGSIATVLSTVLGSHFFLERTSEPLVEQWDRVILFMLVGGVITASSTLLRRSREQLSASLWNEQKARAVAEAADRAKDDFLALISHELRTPLSVVLGWMEAIRQGRLGQDALEHALDAVDRNARILSRLVDDVLDRSRMVTGRLRLDPQIISLGAVVRAAADQMRGKIELAGLNLEVRLPAEDPTIVGDFIRLQQVFTNLLSNALKFTPKSGRISVAIDVADVEAHVTVADSGSGIAPDLLPHVFDAFRQGVETRQQSPQGLGLGLSIARYLVEHHDGTITAASSGPGRGAVFTVTLPRARLNEHGLQGSARHGRRAACVVAQ